MKKIIYSLLLLTGFIPTIAEAATYSQKVTVAINDINALVIEILLWFIFITVSSFVTYFIVNTFILISNNRRYRQLLHKPDDQKSEMENKLQYRTLTAVKAAETRLGMLGVIIAAFILAYVLLSSYIYLGPSVREQMWKIIYYAVGILAITVIVYAIAWLMQKMKYNKLPTDDLQRIRINAAIDNIKKRLKVLLLIIFSLILIYLALLITITKGIQQLSQR
jgi:hypothetical protein